MSDLSAFYGPNAGYVLELYDRYIEDPSSVDVETQQFFASFDPGTLDAVVEAGGNRGTGVISSTAPLSASVANVDLQKIIGAVQLATGIREYGHLAVQTDPLGGPPPGAPEVEIAKYGITEDDLTALPASVVGGPAADGATNALDAITRLRERYTSTLGFDFDHVQIAEERAWLQDAAESGRYDVSLDEKGKKKLLDRLTQVEVFERFLHQTYLGQKRFSIEGTDMMIPMLDQVIDDAATIGAREVAIGMAHRGRLNVLTHILSKPYGAFITAFEGGKLTADAPSEFSDVRYGDVKYHLGARLTRNAETGERLKVPVVLAPNPSHLEAVNPVVLGMTRAAQDERSASGHPDQDKTRALAILIHGDAAFPGQGVVAESLNLSGLSGYNTGGTVHIIANNQIGYTTDWRDSRSTLYAGDMAKGFEIPVIHVNADDPVACLSAARIATEYRKQFGKDFLIDLVGYRRWGHNEGDEPAFTQPLMYKTITKHPTVRKIWADSLVSEGLVTTDDVAGIEKRYFDRLTKIRQGITEGTDSYIEEAPMPKAQRAEVETSIPEDRLREIQHALHALPEGFTPNSKLKRQLSNRAAVLDTEGGKFDWAHAESVAFAAILQDGTPIRLTGQDAQRGTFSQRHLVLHDAKTGDLYTPMEHIPGAKASFAVYNSPLSENACMGFEYGYSVQAPEALVLWEGQFGDFANGAQIIIDQFLSSARSKWGQTPSLVLLLPHGYEGQGPEHSSARLERYLQLAAQDNFRVANCTTAAQYYHLLRRQAARLESDPRPLILMTPKSLLRHPMAASAPEEFTQGTFKPVLDDPKAADRKEKVTRLILCSGKVAIDLESAEERENAEHVAIVRVEQLAPFQNSAIAQVVESYPNIKEVVWLQEEPRNMGAWRFMRGKLVAQFGRDFPVYYIGRPESASPAEGSADLHARAQSAIIRAAFAEGLPEDASLPKELAARQNLNGTKIPAVDGEKVAATTAN
jgi:2-oxoglutarate dehydrogenase E1 component